MKKKKMLLVLPLLVIPFLTMAFWALGGGKGKKQMAETKGLNLDLPDANLKEDKSIDKLGFYEQAEKDSLKQEELLRSDPYFRADTMPGYGNELEDFTNNNKYGQRLNTSVYDKPVNNPEDQILKKLQMLQKDLEKQNIPLPPPPEGEKTPSGFKGDNEFSNELNRLESMLSGNNNGGGDPEMDQLQNTLDKILDVQHPELVKQRSLKDRGTVYAVRKETGVDTLVKGFYSYSEEKELLPKEENAIEAIVSANQSIVNGGVVKFRTVSDVYINGKLIPTNNLVSGIASLDGERLIIEINSIRTGKSLYNVKLEVFDMDGLPGIYIPGTINREVAKESLNNSLTLADIGSLDPSLKAQATATGIGAIKSLVSKKAKLIRVQLKAGYKILFKNKNQDQ